MQQCTVSCHISHKCSPKALLTLYPWTHGCCRGSPSSQSQAPYLFADTENSTDCGAKDTDLQVPPVLIGSSSIEDQASRGPIPSVKRDVAHVKGTCRDTGHNGDAYILVPSSLSRCPYLFCKFSLLHLFSVHPSLLKASVS